MESETRFYKNLISTVILVILIIILASLYDQYKLNYFNDFSRAELILHKSQFARDKENQYTKGVYSYRIKSDVMNDATLFKTLNVEKNTPYKVTCMVKTENVVPENTPSEAGAHISIIDTVEKSESIIGTNDWQELVFYFNSYGRETVDIGFRLGGFRDNCTGTAWFSDFKVEKGVKESDSTWNVACFVIPYTDVKLNNGKVVTAKMSESDIYNTKVNMQRFQNSTNILSSGLINIEYDYIFTNETLKTITNDNVNGNYISGKDVAHIIDPYLEQKEYDYIFIVAKLGDASKKVEIEVNDWIGLGSMTYKGIGFSNIRIPSSEYNRIYAYSSVNTFPEEVFVHEFLHDLERISKASKYDVPDLHDYEKYGYHNEPIVGQREWYRVYLTQKIYDTNTEKYIGISPEIYQFKPSSESEFKYAREIEFIKEPENIIEELSQIFNKNYKTMVKKIERESVDVLVLDE